MKLRVWNVKNWKPLELLAASESLDPQVTQMAFSPDGSLLAVLSQWERNVKILHTRDGRERAVLETGGYARSLRFSPDGRTLAIALETLAHYGRRGPNKSFGEVQFWDLGSFKRQKRIQGFATWDLERGLQVDSRWINLGHEMTLSPNATLLATSYLDKILLWNVATRNGVPVGAHGMSVYTLEFSPNGRTLATTTEGPATASEMGDIHLWDTATGCLDGTLRHPLGHWARSVTFSPDGEYLAAFYNPWTPNRVATPNSACLWQLKGNRRASAEPVVN
ncbi:MAG: WD40 repeat domain-containing protein [Thermoguttaceae bacterium]